MTNLNENQNLNYEQKKNNGKGVFYGVIAVATLIVAIIGATFAYFTASASSSNEALKATAAHVQVNYHEGRQLVATNLIPSSATVVAQAYANKTAYEKNIEQGCTHTTGTANTESNPESYTEAGQWSCPTGKSAYSTGDVGTKCVDDNGYYVCAVYQFTVTNSSNVKQALTAYMQINKNDFRTVEKSAGDSPIDDNNANGALKFMTVRSGDLINVGAIDSTNDNCTNDLYAQDVTQGIKSTKFCVPVYESCTQSLIETQGHDCYKKTTKDHYQASSNCTSELIGTPGHACYGKTTEDKYLLWKNDVAADGDTVHKADQTNPATGQSYGEANGVFTDTSGDYYYFNTTAVPQSLHRNGNQAVFNGEILPSIGRNYLSTGNKLVYMYNTQSKEEANLKVGTPDSPDNLPTVYADSNGYLYESAQACASGKEFNAVCSENPVYFSTTSCQRVKEEVRDGETVTVKDESCFGVYGQVNRTFYIVAWLEENDKSQDEDQDKTFATTIHVTSGSLDANGGITGYMN